jgi:general secretion pathway protein F
MPAFQYQALDSQGQPTQGLIESDNERSAKQLLRGQGLIPLSVSPVGSVAPETPWWRRPIHLSKIMGTEALVTFTRQLSGLMQAGLTLDRALTALMEDVPARQSGLIAALRAEVNAGHGLARAMALQGPEFPPVYQAVIAAGEQSGQFGAILKRLADDLEADHQLKQKVWAAVLYPVIVSIVAMMIVLFLLGSVVPQIAQVFANNQQTLPGLTRFMLGLSGLVQMAGWPAVAAVALLAGRRALRQEALRLRWDRAWLSLPLIGVWLRNYHAARLASTLASLTGAAVPILKSLSSAADTVPNLALRADLKQAAELVREGAPLAVALTHQGRWPRLLAMFIRLGEQSGQLPLMLTQVATQLREQVQRRSLQWATVLEPVLILVMGGVVMLIVLSVMLPIIELNQMVR